MLALFYLVSLLLGGISLVSLLRLTAAGKGAEGRLAIGMVLGQAGGVWVLYFLSSLTGLLSGLVIILTSIVLLLPFLASVFFPLLRGKSGLKWSCLRWHLSTEFLVLLSVLAVFFTSLNIHAILPADAQGNLYATEHVWADTPFHVSIINSFAERDNFPPEYPILVGAPLRYPFLVDLHTAALVEGGMSLRQGIVVSNVLLQIPIFLLIYLIARELGGSRRTGLLASLVFLLLGNFGFLLAFKDIARSGGFFSWLSHLPWGYTGSSLGVESRESIGVGLYLGNPTYLFFMPRRAVTFGVAVGLTLMLILLRLVGNRGQYRADGAETRPHDADKTGYLPFVAAGLLLGLLPRIHSHSFLAMVVITGFLLASSHWWGTGRRDFYVKAALLVAVTAAVSLPQLLGVREQVSHNFFNFWPGWIGEAHETLAGLGKPHLNMEWIAHFAGSLKVFAKFWIWNAGMLLLLPPFALWRSSRNQVLFYIPFVLLFIIGNAVKIQPWEWDNNNLFLYWQIGTVLVVAVWLGRVRASSLKAIRYALFCFFIAMLITGGVLNIIRTSQERNFLWGAQEVRIAKWVRENTPPGSLFLTGSAHNHPIPSLGGRQVVMGFEGWLFAHGLSYDTIQSDEVKMFRGDMPLLEKYGVEYVADTPYERAFAQARGFTLNESFFRNPELFELVYREDNLQGSWEIYRVRVPCPKK